MAKESFEHSFIAQLIRLVCLIERSKYEPQPREMCVRSNKGQSVWMTCNLKMYRSQPRYGGSSNINGRAKNGERSSTAYLENRRIKQICPKSCREKLILLQNPTKRTKIRMGPEHSKAFQDLKYYLARIIKLSPPMPGIDLLLYLWASDSAVSAARNRRQYQTTPNLLHLRVGENCICITHGMKKIEALLRSTPNNRGHRQTTNGHIHK